MCGICGIWYFDPARPVDEPMLRAMLARLAHRGPDGAGVHVDGSVGLGACRLSIVDALHSQQPILNEDGRVWVVGNGEIYNFRSLRSDRHRFRTEGDIETIVHLYEDVGTGCVDQLRGMYAFALWDKQRETLMLATDRFGKKSLYYLCDSEKLVFGSELKALLCVPGVPRELDWQALDEYLSAGYINAPRCIFRHIRKLAPGEVVLVRQAGRLEARRYWMPRFAEASSWDRRSREEQAAELRSLLEDSVRLRLSADQPPGAFLSGGVDSTSVVALMAQFSGSPVKTFSIGFDSPAYDESPYACAAADHLHTDHTSLLVREDSLELLPSLVAQFDEPFADSSMLPTYLVSRLARQSVKAVLSGDGGDEVFAGYHQHLYAYRQHYLQTRIPEVLHPLARRAASRLPRAVKLKPYLAVVGDSPSRWLTGGFFTPAQRRRLYSPELSEVMVSSIDEALSDWDAGHLDALSQVQQHDLMRYLPGDILTKVDRASMFASLEVRCPLLDHTVFEFMARIPPERRIGLRSGKSLLRHALAPLLPPFIYQRRKQGFSLPQSEWLRGALAPRLRQLAADGIDDWFDRVYIRELVDDHLTGCADHSDRLWALLCLDMWM
jgi:asparagine synthase (glutamine-hydrolysing)